VIVVDGVDLARQLPTIGGAVIRAKLAGAKLVVIDSRRHRVAESADFFLQLKPGTETLLYGAMAKVIVDRGLANLPFIKAHCRGYEQFLARVRDYDLLAAEESCGVAADLIEAAALVYARARSVAILYSTGIESRDAEPVKASVNPALLTGQIGREGAGIFALTEHNNLQGVCDMGMLPDRLPGYREVASDPARAELGHFGERSCRRSRAWPRARSRRTAATARCEQFGSAATTRSAPLSLATRPTRYPSASAAPAVPATARRARYW
jgi:predicted molibdopterin-dependent oxidoreductase YjgC